MLIIIGRTLNMLKSQIEAQGAAFEETGGFSERLTTRRLEAREKNREARPRAHSAGNLCAAGSPRKANSGVARLFPTAKAFARSNKAAIDRIDLIDFIDENVSIRSMGSMESLFGVLINLQPTLRIASRQAKRNPPC